MPSLTLELTSKADPEKYDEYEVEEGSFTAPTPVTFDDPGDGGEIEIGDVTVKRHGSDTWEKVPESVLFEHYVEYNGLKDDVPSETMKIHRCQTALDKAREAIENQLFEKCLARYEDDDDRDGFYDD